MLTVFQLVVSLTSLVTPLRTTEPVKHKYGACNVASTHTLDYRV